MSSKHHNHIANQIKNPFLQNDNTLHVVGVITNPVRFHSRLRLFRQWRDEMLGTPNVKLYVVEGVYGDRKPECAPEAGQDYEYLSVKLDSEIWLKENLINIGIDRLLPHNWKYACASDCDVSFRNSGWALNTIHQLQHYNVVQPWTTCADLDFHGNIQNTWTSFGSLCASGRPMWHSKEKPEYGTYAHTGYALAFTRYFYENVGGLIDFCIVGAGDHHGLWACVNKIEGTIHSEVGPEYLEQCLEWQRKAFKACAGLVGATPGRIEHHWHGSKVKRGYWSRWDILLKSKFNPKTDISYDSQGVLKLCGSNKYEIEKMVMAYNRSRMEDEISD